MLGLETKYKLKEFFKQIADEENQIERQRQKLASVQEFEPFASFQRVNRKGDKQINALEIYSFMRDNDYRLVTLSDCQFIINYFDLDKDGYLSYNEYILVTLPCEDMFLRSVATQRPNYPVSSYQRLSPAVERELATLFDKEIAYHQKIERLKHELQMRYDFSSSAAFSCIDVLRDGEIHERNLAQFMKYCGYFATETELGAIIRRLDIDGDGKVSLSEFIEGMQVQESSKEESKYGGGGQLGSSQYGAGPGESKYGGSLRASSPLRQGPSPRVRSPMRESSPLRRKESPGRSPMRSSGYLGVPGATKSGAYGASPGRTGMGASMMMPREGHASPIRPRVEVTRDLMQKSASKQLQSSGAYQSPARNASSSNQRRSPLKPDDEEELIRAFKEQISLEKELEDAKALLAQQPDFNLMDAFQMLDHPAKGWISSPELVDALASVGLYAHKDDVYLFLRRYDKDSDGRLLYSDFCEAFSPKDSSMNQMLSSRRAYFLHKGVPRREYFSPQTRDLFLRTFKVHFGVEESAELLRKRLGRRPNFSVHDAFSAVDVDKNGYITRDEFKKVLQEYGFWASQEEVAWLLMRYDRNGDGRISYSEFIDEILPKSPQKR